MYKLTFSVCWWRTSFCLTSSSALIPQVWDGNCICQQRILPTECTPCPTEYGSQGIRKNPVSILHKSIAGRYRPVRVADGPITARFRFMLNASWEDATGMRHQTRQAQISSSKCPPPRDQNIVKPRWLKHLWDHRNLFETWVVRATEG